MQLMYEPMITKLGGCGYVIVLSERRQCKSLNNEYFAYNFRAWDKLVSILPQN